jgi:tripartite-type tricarboxylate transporter receptor subunit TctC
VRLIAFCVCINLLCAGVANAADPWPSQPIKLIVPQGAGGANDTLARIYGQKLSDVLGGKPVIVENRAGAGGTIATAAVAKARPDGYTLLVTLTSSHTVAPALFRNVPFDSVKDFEPVALLATAAYMLVSGPSFPPNSVAELIAHAKANPGAVTYASAGNGTLNHLLGAMLEQAATIDMVHVPYKSASASVTDVLAGRVPLSFQSVASAISFVKAGKLKVLGVTSEKRVAVLPSVPTIGETLPGFSATPWYGLLAPAGTPREIIDRLYGASQQVLQDKDVREKFAANGADATAGKSRAEFTALIRSDLDKWGQAVKRSGATVD